MPLSSSDDRGIFIASEKDGKMEWIAEKKNEKKTLAELVGTNVKSFSEVFKKVMEIKGVTIQQLAKDTDMSVNGLYKMRDKSRKPVFISVVKVALGMMLQHDDFYWFLSQANFGLSDFREYDRYVKSYVDRGYKRWDVKTICTVSENDPWLFQKAA